jgi:hypothetical protein
MPAQINMQQFDGKQSKAQLRRSRREGQCVMNPMMLHMLLLRAVSEGYAHRVVSRLKDGHDEIQLHDESGFRLNGIRCSLPHQAGIGTEQSLAQPISHKKPRDGTHDPYRRLAPNTKRHTLAFRHRMDTAPGGITEQNIFDAGLMVA